MVKVEHQKDYLKGDDLEVTEPLKEEQNARQSTKPFQPKLRVRRHYNPGNINISKLFLAIREHRTGNPQLNKISEIKELLTQVENINDIDLDDGGNTPLHVAVSKGHQDVVELLLSVSDIDPKIKNDQGDTPLDIAMRSGNQIITGELQEYSELGSSNQQVSSIEQQPRSDDTLKELQTREPISIFQEIARAEDQSKKQNLKDLLDKLTKSYSDDLKIGVALKTGDCFFDSVAQGLNELKDKGLVNNIEKFNVKSLREDCVNDANKYRDKIIKNAEGYFVPQKNIAFSHLGNIKDEKGNDVPDMQGTFDKYLDNIKKTSEEGDYPIWGRPEIEGQMISNKYDVVLYFYSANEDYGEKITVTKIIPGGDEPEVFVEGENLDQLRIDSNKKVVRIVNYKQHFVPLLSNLEQNIDEPVQVFEQEVYGRKVNKPIALGMLFIGREVELQDLYNKMQSRSGKVVVSQVEGFNRLGGVGKTSLVLEYVKRYGKDHHENGIIWIDANSEASLTKSFYDIWHNSEKTDKNLDNTYTIESIVKNVYESLNDNLFILDNATNNHYLLRFLPESFFEQNSKSPKVLITSRSQDWPPSLEVIRLGVLSISEAREFVIDGLNYRIDSQDGRIDSLIGELGFSPASIKQAIGYIRINRERSFDIDDYLTQYKRQKTSSLNDVISRGSYDEATFVAFKTTIDRIKSRKINGQAALSVLNVLSYLHHKKIKQELLETLITTLDKKKLKYALKLLKKHSIISVDPLTHFISIDQSVQEVVRIELKQMEKDTEVIKEIIISLDNASLSTQELFLHLEELLHHIDDLLLEQNYSMTEVEELCRIKLSKYIMDNYIAFRHVIKSRELVKSILLLSKNQPSLGLAAAFEAITMLYNIDGELESYHEISNEIEKFEPLVGVNLEGLELLANNFRILAKYDKEREILYKIFGIHSLAQNHLEIARTLVRIGICHDKLLLYDNAVNFFNAANQIFNSMHGIVSNNELASCLEYLAHSKENLHLYRESIEFLQKVLELKSSMFGLESTQCAMVLKKLGLLYFKNGDEPEAIAYSEDALTIMERNGVEDHQIPEFLYLLNMVYHSFSLFEKRKQIMDRILEIEEVYRDSCPQVVDLFREAAETYGDIGDRNKQSIFLEKYLSRSDNIFDSYLLDSSARIEVIKELSGALISLGEYQKAQSLLEESLITYSIEITSTDGYVGILSKISLLNELEKASRLSSNLERVNEVRELKWQIQRKSYKYVGLDERVLNVVADNFIDLNDYTRAKDILEKILKIMKKKNKLSSASGIRLLKSLSKVYDDLGYFDKKIDALNKILEIQRNLNKQITLHEASTLEILGRSYFELGEHNLAYRRLMQSLIIKKYLHGTENSDMMSIIEWLADTYIDQNYPGQSRNILGGVRVEELTLETLSKPSDQLSEYEKKSTSLIKYLTIKHNVNKRRDFDMITTLEWLARICVSEGHEDLGKKLLEGAMDIVMSNEVNDQVEVPKDLFNEYPSLGTEVKSLADAFVEFFNDHIQAKKLLSQALKIEKAFYGSKNVRVVSQLRMLARANQMMGDLVERKALLREASSILKEQGKANRHWSMESLVEAANVYRDLGDPVKQREYLEKAYLIINDSRYLGRVPDPIDIMKELSLCYESFPDLHLKQKELLEEILVTQKRRFGYEHFELVETLKGLSEIYLLLERPNKQEEKLKEGLSILDLHKDKYQDTRYRFLEELSEFYLGTDDEKHTYYEERIKKEFPSSACLAGSSPSGMRRKREAESGCLFTWEDIDEFNEEKDERRDLSKIKIDGKKLLSYIKDLPEEKQSQLIHLADEVKIKGSFKGLVSRLISNQKVMNHLGRVEKISGMGMHGMMAKNVLADFLNGNYKGVAVNLGFIAGGRGFAKVAEAASLKGLKLAEEGKLLVGTALKAASPFLARCTSAFVVYDLVNQIKAFKNGTEEALVGVVGDSIYLGIDSVEIGVEVAEAFGVLEGVSSVTGPIGATIGAVVFVGTDIYMAVERVDKIDELIHLTGNEKFIEGLRAFIGMKPEQYIQELIDEKQIYTQLFKQGLEYLKDSSDTQRYVVPTGKLVDVCSEVPSDFNFAELGVLIPIMMQMKPESPLEPLRTPRSPYIDYFKKCVKKFKVDLDNIVLLDRKVGNITWNSRTIPEYLNDGKLFCLTKEDGESAPSYGSYYCEGAIGVVDLSPNKKGNRTLIALGKGNDIASGFKDSPGVFLVEDGDKKFTGGDKDDLFILMDNNITGMLKGGGGIDTLDLTKFARNVITVEVDLLNTGYVMYDGNYLWMRDVESVLGRKGSSESISSSCDTKFLDGQGSSGNTPDTILIRSQESGTICSYKIQIVVRPNTNIKNQAYIGEFNYIVLPSRGKAVVNISSFLGGEVTDRHNFFFNSSVSQLMGMYIQNVTQIFNYTVRSATFSFLSSEFNSSKSYSSSDLLELPISFEVFGGFSAMSENNFTQIPNGTIRMGNVFNFTVAETDKLVSELNTAFYNEMFNITISDIPVNASYRFSNGAEIRIGNKGNMYMLESTNKSSEEVIRDYLPVANRVSKMSFFIQSLLSNETVVIGSGNHEVIHSNPAYRSHLVGNGGENVYVIDSGTTEVIIHDVDEENSIDTIDLRNVVRKAKEVRVIKFENDLLLRAIGQDSSIDCTVVLKDGVERYNKTHVLLRNVPMAISIHNNQWSLKPQLLMFEKDKEIIVLTGQDVEKDTELIISRKGGNYTFVRSNSNDLMITNAFDSTITKDDFCSITLSKFYKTPKMKTLSIKFADKEIVLKDHEKEISMARDVNVVKKEHKDQVYNDVFNPKVMMLSDQPVTHIRHSRHREQARHRRGTTSSSTRPTGWINDLFGWVKSSVSGLLSSQPESTPSSISQVDARVDVNGTIMLLDMLIRKVTGRKYISTVDQSISPLEAQGYALNITKGFEKVVEQAGLKSGVSMHRLNIDYMGMQKEITRKVMSGNFNEISGILSSYVEKAFPGRGAGKLSPKKFDKFMVEFNKGLLNQSIEQILHNGDSRLEVDGAKEMSLEPQGYLSNVSVQGHSKDKVSTCLSEIGVTKLGGNLNR